MRMAARQAAPTTRQNQRRHMMQERSDTVDAWVDGKKCVPMLIPLSLPIPQLDPAL
ncbi:hypothetical protein [Rhizobium binxianense]